jgi:hypothetical protein
VTKVVRQSQLKQNHNAVASTFELPAAAPVASVAMAQSNDLPQWAQLFMMMFGGLAASGCHLPPSHHSPPSRDRLASLSPTLTAMIPQQFAPKRPEPSGNTPIEYPALQDWLQALEEHPIRNKHKELFSQLVPLLVETHKLYTIEDVISFNSQEFAGIAQVDIGMASRILRYAKEDVQALERAGRKRTRY